MNPNKPPRAKAEKGKRRAFPLALFGVVFLYINFSDIQVFLTQWNRREQRVGRAEQAQVIGDDYATVEKCWDEYVSLAEAAIFEYAFRLGARLVMEVQKDS